MKTNLTQNLQGRLAMTFSLRQALKLLELPQLELASYLMEEIEKNPLLELDKPSPWRAFDPSRVEAPETLYNHLMRQIRERFPDPSAAFSLLEQMDERGYLPPDTPDSGTLSALHEFDPPGIFARSLRECLLLQLDPDSLAYRIVNTCFEELLRGQFKEIRKKMGTEELPQAIRSLARLALRPADIFRAEPDLPIIPDLSISKIGKTWLIEAEGEDLPQFHLREDYLSLAPESPEERKAIRGWASSGKWLLRSLKRRKSILLAIGASLVKRQADYLDRKGDLQPLSLKELALRIHLHESTLSRALSNKYAATPRGILPLRALLPSGSDPAKELLQRLIRDESSPLSDSELAASLENAGHRIARRTVAKYRDQLGIAPSSRRQIR